MKRATLYLSVMIMPIFFIRCKGDDESMQKNENKKSYITGRYINQSVLDQASDSIIGLLPHYFYEMAFKDSDSVFINYGFEEAVVPFKKVGDHYVLDEGNHLPFTVNTDGSITLSDSSWTKVGDTTWVGKPLNSKFVKVSDVAEGNWVFEQYLNKQMVVGTYQPTKQGTSEQQVSFTKEGKVSGLENYISYSICYSGDCVGETIKPSNLITFHTSDNKDIMYAFTIDKKKGALNLFTISAPIKDIKGERNIQEIVYTLQRVN